MSKSLFEKICIVIALLLICSSVFVYFFGNPEWQKVYSQFGLIHYFDGIITGNTFPFLHPLIFLSAVMFCIIILGSCFINGRRPIDLNLIFEISEIEFWRDLGYYIISGFIQQFLLVSLFLFLQWGCRHYNINIDTVFIPAVAAGIFGLLHFPNFLLVFATIAMGYIFLHHFDVYHNVFLISIIHAILGNTLSFFMPERNYSTFEVLTNYMKLHTYEPYHRLVCNRLAYFLESYIQNGNLYSREPYIVLNRKKINHDRKNSQGIKLQPWLHLLYPDIAWVEDSSHSGPCIQHLPGGIPDFVAEVSTPSSYKEDYCEKFRIYHTLGVKEYWIINLKEKNISCYELDQSQKCTKRTLITKSNLFPAIGENIFKIMKSKIFKDMDECI
jgi:hypothetical protein